MTDKKWLIGLIIGLLCVSSNVHSADKKYTTGFSYTENPLSNGGNWIQGGTNGVLWTDVVTNNGHAVGTQAASDLFDDSVACLTGEWGADQSAEGIAYAGNQTGGGLSGWGDCTREIELLLRWQITPNNIRGYEINFGGEGKYGNVCLNRWDGPRPGWHPVYDEVTGERACSTAEWTGGNNGDTLKATIVGNVITVYKNGTVILTARDSKYPSGGSPGIGFFTSDTCSGPDYHNNDYGWTAFTGASIETGAIKIPKTPSIISISK